MALEVATRTTEERTFQLLGLLWTGADESSRKEAAQRLLAEEREGGGWAQLPRFGSDAYSTGVVLYSLYQGGQLATTEPAYQRGLHFLLKKPMARGWSKVGSIPPFI